MAKRFTKTVIDWAEFAKRVPPNEKQKYLVFKAKTEKYWLRINANPPKPPKINWEDYQKIIPVDGLVDKLKSAYEAFKVPYPDDTLSSKVDEQWNTLQPDIKKFCAERQKDIDAAQKELNRVKALPKLEDITLEMYYDMFPNEAFDPVNRQSFWPHTPEEQPGYLTPEQKALKEAKHS